MSTAPSTRSQREKPLQPRVAHVRISGVTTSAPEKSDSHHVRQTSANWSAGMTFPSRSDVVPKLALMSVPTAAAPTSAKTSPTRSRPVRVPIRRRRMSAATTTSSVLPSVWPSTVPSGEEKSATSRSPMTIPGHSRVP